MKSKIILFSSICSLLFVLAACNMQKQQKTVDTDIRSACCEECLAAFNKSPVGVGAEAARCGTFSTADTLSSKCQQYFEKNSVMVGECE